MTLELGSKCSTWSLVGEIWSNDGFPLAEISPVIAAAWEHVDYAEWLKWWNDLGWQIVEMQYFFSPFNCSHCDPEIWMLNNSHPQTWELNTTGFEWSIASSAKYASAMWCTSGREGISGDFKTHLSRILQSYGLPPVEKWTVLSLRRWVTWPERAEQLVQKGSLRLWKRFNSRPSSSVLHVISAWTRLRGEKLHQSLMCFCTRLLCFLLHIRGGAICVVTIIVVTSYKHTLADRQRNRNQCFFFLRSSLKWEIFFFLYCLIVRCAAVWRSG